MTPIWQKQKYSLVERERRFLLESLPEDLPLETFRVIEDKYFPDTRLRLRKITDAAGKTLELKLTQKFADQDHKGEERVTTNLYLTEHEYALLSVLSGHQLKKRRYSYYFEKQHYSIDVFEENLSGLMLAEIEFDKQTTVTLPPFALRDVTEDAFFTGGHLAMTNQEQFHIGLERYFEHK